MREYVQAGYDNVERHKSSIKAGTAGTSAFLAIAGGTGFIMRETGMASPTTNAVTGAIGGVMGLVVSIPQVSNYLLDLFGAQADNQDQQTNQNACAEWAKRTLLTASTALIAIGGNMMMESILSATKDTADNLEPYPPVHLSPYIAAAIGGATLATTLAGVISTLGGSESLITPLGSIMYAAALVPGATKSFLLAAEALKGKSYGIDDHLIDNMGDIIFRGGLAGSACIGAGALLSSTTLTAYYMIDGMIKEPERQRIALAAQREALAERQRPNKTMSALSELIVRSELQMDLGDLETLASLPYRLPTNAIALIAEYASPVSRDVQTFVNNHALPVPRQLYININDVGNMLNKRTVNPYKLNLVANTHRAVQGIKFIRESNRLAEEEGLDQHPTTNISDIQLMEEGLLSHSSSHSEWSAQSAQSTQLAACAMSSRHLGGGCTTSDMRMITRTSSPSRGG